MPKKEQQKTTKSHQIYSHAELLEKMGLGYLLKRALRDFFIAHTQRAVITTFVLGVVGSLFVTFASQIGLNLSLAVMISLPFVFVAVSLLTGVLATAFSMKRKANKLRDKWKSPAVTGQDFSLLMGSSKDRPQLSDHLIIESPNVPGHKSTYVLFLSLHSLSAQFSYQEYDNWREWGENLVSPHVFDLDDGAKFYDLFSKTMACLNQLAEQITKGQFFSPRLAQILAAGLMCGNKSQIREKMQACQTICKEILEKVKQEQKEGILPHSSATLLMAYRPALAQACGMSWMFMDVRDNPVKEWQSIEDKFHEVARTIPFLREGGRSSKEMHILRGALLRSWLTQPNAVNAILGKLEAWAKQPSTDLISFSFACGVLVYKVKTEEVSGLLARGVFHIVELPDQSNYVFVDDRDYENLGLKPNMTWKQMEKVAQQGFPEPPASHSLAP